MVAHTFNPRTQETEKRESMCVQYQPDLHGDFEASHGASFRNKTTTNVRENIKMLPKIIDTF